MVLFELLFHRVFDLVRVFQVHRHHAQRVANEVDGEMVFQNAWIVLKELGFLRLFDVLFKRDHASGLHGLGQQEQERQKILIVGRLPLRAGKDLPEILEDFHDRCA